MLQDNHRLLATVAVLLVVFLGPGSRTARCEASVFWGGLSPGPHLVGFEAVEKYDYSRTFREKYYYDGVPYDGERARPIQICVWYPASPRDDATPLVLSEYLFPLPEDSRFFDILSQLQARELGSLFGLLGNNRALVQDMINLPVSAVSEAPRLAGTFPLVVYFANSQTGISEDAVLCEYLASHGFIVATSHSLGAVGLTPDMLPLDVEATVRDRELVLGHMRDYSNVNPDRVGLIGRGYGGLGALIMQMRNSDVDAVAAVDPLFTYRPLLEFAAGSPFYDATRMQVPLMIAYPSGVDEMFDKSLVEDLPYSDRCFFGFPMARRQNLSSYGIVAAIGLDTTGAADISSPSYEAFCRHTLDFMKAYLLDDSSSLESLNSPAMGAGDIVASVLPASTPPPTEAQFSRLIEADRIEKAVDIFYQLKKSDPDLVIFQEATLNALGYNLLTANRLREAAIIFKLNTEAYPNSANVWDSYADACIASGDTQAAITCYERVLEVLPGDSAVGPGIREILQNNATQGLERLRQ
ncbi:MAG: hypothetical protein JSW34_10110 [Candidatus Zixiibacteriota bacterium]|nr:MAG: hypothetical protein JSW34_10110 [candidate division Zixibacteria bacterium]